MEPYGVLDLGLPGASWGFLGGARGQSLGLAQEIEHCPSQGSNRQKPTTYDVDDGDGSRT